jgi:hypothetical protein
MRLLEKEGKFISTQDKEARSANLKQRFRHCPFQYFFFEKRQTAESEACV